MHEPGSLSSAFRVESLEWSPHDGGATLRVRGRWRRRRPAGAGAPQLVVTRGGQRQRFPATPEPPGLGGAEPGTWQMSFSVPDEWVPVAGDRTWLQVGAVMISLPIGGELELEEIPAPVRVPPALLTERRLHAAELALEAAHARAAAAERRQAELEAERERLAGELEAARHALGEQDRARRLAEQREYAERAERLELQRELAALADGRTPADGAVAALAERIGELEAERDSLERRLLEAEQLRAAAQADRRRAEADLARRPAGGPLSGHAAVLGAEAALARSRPPSIPAEPSPGTGFPSLGRALLHERRMISARGAARGRTAPASGRLHEVLDAIGAELSVLRTALVREREARAAAQARADALGRELDQSRRRASDAHAALGRLRAELSAGGARRRTPEPAVRVVPRAPEPAPPSEPGATPSFDPGRLDAARSRLRTSATEPEPPAGSAWIARALRSLGAEDPAAAGRLVLALLPVHALRGDPAVRYDLVLADAGVVCVDVPGEGHPVEVRAAQTPRAATAVDFAFHGDLAALGRFALAGGSRRWRRDRGRITGERTAAATLAGIAAARLRWRALLEAGVALDGWLALALAARAIDPAQTRGEHFAIGFAEPGAGGAGLLLQVADGRRPAVTQAPFTSPAGITEIRVAASELAALLAGVEGVDAELRGEPRALERVRGWIELAQSG